MKKTLIFVFVCFLLLFDRVYAVEYIGGNFDEFVSHKGQAYLRLCSYDTVYMKNVLINGAYQKKEARLDGHILYDLKTNNFVVAWNPNDNSKLTYYPGSISRNSSFKNNLIKIRKDEYYAFDNVFSQNDIDYSNFKCPKHGYSDLALISAYNEYCFDDNGTWCAKSASNNGTKFGSESKQGEFVKSELVYDAMTRDIGRYFQGNSEAGLANAIFDDLKCDDVVNGTVSMDNLLETKINKDFSNYTQGYPVPDFIMALFRNNYSNLNKYRDDFIANCKKQYEESGLSGQELDDVMSNFNYTTDLEDQVHDAGESAANGIQNGINDPNMIIDNSAKSCKDLLGPNLTAVVHAGITAIKIIGAIIAIVKGMMVLLPAIIAKDADGLKKSSKTLVTMAIILVVIFLFTPLLRFIGNVAGFDITCLT